MKKTVLFIVSSLVFFACSKEPIKPIFTDKDITYSSIAISTPRSNENPNLDTLTLIYIPNAFSPNKDGKNDEFRIMSNHIENYFSIAIYDRWGTTVFESTDFNKGWDGNVNGQKMGTGLYNYKLTITEKRSGLKHEYNDKIALIR